jgi:natural product precursor
VNPEKKDKKVKKLKLSKETIRNLQEAELGMVFGGTDGGCSPSGNCCSCPTTQHLC